MRRTVLAVGLLSVLTLVGCNRNQGAGEGQGGGKVAACRSQDLALKRVSEDASVGLVSYRFENRGADPCSLKGYPSIALTGPDGATLDATVQQFEPPPVVSRRGIRVVLRPGASAVQAVRKADRDAAGLRLGPGLGRGPEALSRPDERVDLHHRPVRRLTPDCRR
jgi:hypothetical protein